MSEGDESGTGGGQLRRWGPLAAIVVVAAVVIGVLVAGGGGDDDEGDGEVSTETSEGTGDETGDDTSGDDASAGDDSGDDSGDGGDDAPVDDPFADGIVSFSEAAAAGIEGDIDWGERCDTELGTYAYPDFFAAECVAPWEGDNGGETYPGVTADTIKIVWYTQPDVDPVYDYITGPINNDDTGDDVFATVQGLVDFYSSYFESYGREVELIRYDATGTSDDEVAARADAETIARDIRPFMVWNSPTLVPLQFAETLAANEVMCMCGGGQLARENVPFMFTIVKSAEQSRLLMAEYVGERLAGRNAEHSGDFTDQERVFGYLYIETSDQSTQTAEDFRDRLADDYDVELADMVPFTLDPASLQEQAATKIARMKDAGVTSIIFAGDPISPRDFTLEATAQQYFPEWILTGTNLVDTNTFGRTYDQEQWQHAFGISNTDTPVAREKGGYHFLYNWFYGEPPPAADTIPVLYHPAVFFPTMQGTGPDLTPENYFATMFNAPPTPQGQITNPSISFGDQGIWPDEMLPDVNGIDDVSEVWWDPNETGLDELEREGTGMYQYVGGGTRYLPGQWPDTAPDVFNPDNAESFYDEPPASETPPPYPSPAG